MAKGRRKLRVRSKAKVLATKPPKVSRKALLDHNTRLAHLRRGGHKELADKVGQVALEQGYENDFLAVDLKPAGEGHHFSLMTASGLLKSYWRWDLKKTIEYLETLYDSSRDSNAVSEAVSKVFSENRSRRKRRVSKAKYPDAFQGLAEAIKPASYRELKIKHQTLDKKSSHEILHSLFPNGNSFINLSTKGQSAGNTRLLSEWKDEFVKSKSFIVPNPMKDYTGVTKSGEESPKCNDNILTRQHIVIEFDSISCKDKQLGILLYLSKYAPLKMILFSGGKSLHGWFDCSCIAGQESWQKFFIIACFFGADRAMATPSQYCRIPNATRDNGEKQSLLYLDSKFTNSSSWNVSGLIRNVKTLMNEDLVDSETSFSKILDSTMAKFGFAEKPSEDSKNPLTMLQRCYYVCDGKSSKYAFLKGNGDYISQKEGDLKRRLKKSGMDATTYEGENCSEVDDFIIEVQDNNQVHYMGGLAGHPKGIYKHAGYKFLVDSEAQLHTPLEGDFPLLKAVLEGITGKGTHDEGDKQFHVFMGWIRRSYIALRDHNRTTAQQALVLAGEQGAGKTLTSDIITALLGGRSADASRYMLKDNDFNGDLCSSEILLLDDKNSSSKIGDRLRFASQIKTHTVATNNMSLHRKGCDAIPVSLFCRMVICVNDNAESLTVLPPLNEDLADKLILLKGYKFKMPWDTTGDGQRQAFWNALKSEMPHFLYWLLNGYKIPLAFQGERYGVISYHHPDIARKLNSQSPEYVLLELIDQTLWEDGEDSWKGTAHDLTNALTQRRSRSSEQAKAFFNRVSTTNTGTYLGRLASKYPDRVKKARSSNKRDWIIYTPDSTNDVMTLSSENG